ncbi:hypothetical protein DLREEDagrD3_00270 [Denitratisoma sp. agr-D3]
MTTTKPGEEAEVFDGVQRVRDIMTRHPVTVPVSATLATAAERMETLRISAVLAEEGGRITGLLTESDVIHAINRGLDGDAAISTVMGRHVLFVSEEDELHAAYHAMVVQDVRHLVATDAAGNPCGIVSETDFRRHYGVRQFIGILDVGRAMSQQYIEMAADATADSAAAAMEQRHLDCVLVLAQGCPVGIVTSRDMVGLFHRQRYKAKLGDIMRAPVQQVLVHSSLTDAVAKMLALNIRRLAVVDESGRMVGILNEHDVTHQLENDYTQMLQKLVLHQAKQLNEDKFRTLVDHLPQKVLVKDAASIYQSCNVSYARDLGITPEAVVGRNDYEFFPVELAERYRADDRRVMESKTAIMVEEPYLEHGERRWVHTTKAPILDASGSAVGIVAVFHDITQVKKDAEDLKRRTWALEAVRSSGRAMVLSSSEEEMLRAVCQAITQQDMYVLAWFGWADEDEAHTVRIVASSGSAASYTDGLKVSWGDGPLGDGPTGRSIRSGQTLVNNNATSKSFFQPWLEAASRYDIHASLSLPITLNNRVAAVLTVYSREAEAFGVREVSLFEELAANLGFGIQSRRTRIAYEHSLQERERQALLMEKSLEDALMAIASTLEQRDPYTAGHQKHVAELAIRIGLEMGLGENELRCLYLAAIVHDLGKIQIPSEILTKPSRLNAAEFNLIKLHPEVGYNILKQISFPWPIADVIRQHHEYLDGSGYPQGLKGNEILMSARIITVADIVESMSSDRPYRPALGIDGAIAEIQRVKGTRLDPTVVDACVAVLRRGEFAPTHLKM